MPPIAPELLRQAEALEAAARDLRRLAELAETTPKTGEILPEMSLADWYACRVEALVAAGERSSATDDTSAAWAAGFRPSRDDIRNLRRDYAPEPWTMPGRSRGKKNQAA